MFMLSVPPSFYDISSGFSSLRLLNIQIIPNQSYHAKIHNATYFLLFNISEPQGPPVLFIIDLFVVFAYTVHIKQMEISEMPDLTFWNEKRVLITGHTGFWVEQSSPNRFRAGHVNRKLNIFAGDGPH